MVCHFISQLVDKHDNGSRNARKTAKKALMRTVHGLYNEVVVDIRTGDLGRTKWIEFVLKYCKHIHHTDLTDEQMRHWERAFKENLEKFYFFEANAYPYGYRKPSKVTSPSHFASKDNSIKDAVLTFVGEMYLLGQASGGNSKYRTMRDMKPATTEKQD
jgi:hypothetical protein